MRKTRRNTLVTPNSRIKAALRQLFLRSRERALCLKENEYKCSSCGKKQSKAKGEEISVQVHHQEGIDNWQVIYDCIRKNLLNKDDMTTLCKECHKQVHKNEKTP